MTIKVLESLKLGSHLLPIPCYWLDLNQQYLGVNPLILEITGTMSYEKDFIGKTPCDFYPSQTGQKIINLHKEALETKEIVSIEELIQDAKTGKMRKFRITIAPLYDEDKKILGTIASLFDITKKEEIAESETQNVRLKISENAHKKQNEYISEYAHNLYSPLTTLLACCEQKSFSEEEREKLKKEVNRIVDISHNLLREHEDENDIIIDQNKVLVSLVLTEVASEKRFVNKDRPWIKISLDIEPAAYFCFIDDHPLLFKKKLCRLLDTLLISAENNPCTLNISLKLDDSGGRVLIAVYSHGAEISITQAIDIFSQPISHKNGIIVFSFLCTSPPEWIATDIKLYDHDTLVILDHDPSMHNVWKHQLESISLSIEVKYCKNSNEALEFIQNFKDKEKLFLLSKFELFQDDHDGLSVIEKTNLGRTILITSYYRKKSVRDRAEQLHTPILPILLTFGIPVKISKETDQPNPGGLSQDQTQLQLMKRIEAGLTKFNLAISNKETFLNEPYHELLFGILIDQKELQIDKKKRDWDEVEFNIFRLDRSVLIHGSSISLDICKTIINNSILDIKNKYKLDLFMLKASEMIFKGFAKKEIIIRCNIIDCLSAIKVKNQFKGNDLKYKVSISSNFWFAGNTIIVDYTIRSILKYFSSNVNIREKGNIFLFTNQNINYNLLVIEGNVENISSVELDEFIRGFSFRFCQHLMHAFGALVSAQIRDPGHLVFILAFPKIVASTKQEDFIEKVKYIASHPD